MKYVRVRFRCPVQFPGPSGSVGEHWAPGAGGSNWTLQTHEGGWLRFYREGLPLFLVPVSNVACIEAEDDKPQQAKKV